MDNYQKFQQFASTEISQVFTFYENRDFGDKEHLSFFVEVNCDARYFPKGRGHRRDFHLKVVVLEGRFWMDEPRVLLDETQLWMKLLGEMAVEEQEHALVNAYDY